MKVNLTIDGVKIQAQAGQTILQVAQEAGIHIPILCHHPALPPEGACRICLVEIERQRSLQPACTFPATEGLVVHTHSEKVVEARKFVLEMLLSDHPSDCTACARNRNCELQSLAEELGIREVRFAAEPRGLPIRSNGRIYHAHDSHPRHLCRHRAPCDPLDRGGCRFRVLGA